MLFLWREDYHMKYTKSILLVTFLIGCAAFTWNIKYLTKSCFVNTPKNILVRYKAQNINTHQRPIDCIKHVCRDGFGRRIKKVCLIRTYNGFEMHN